MSGIKLTSDTLAVTPASGDIEYNGKIFTATPQANTQRGIVPTEQFFRLNAGLAGANATGAQSVFGVGVTLIGSTIYEYELSFVLSKTAGTTSHTVSLGFGGTATLNGLFDERIVLSNSSLTSPSGNPALQSLSSASLQLAAGAITTAGWNVIVNIKGTVSVNAGGTFTPQYSLSAAPGGAYTVQAGSYMKIKPIGSSGANTSVGTWS